MATNTKSRKRPPTKREGTKRKSEDRPADRMLTQEQVAEILAMSPKTIQNWRYAPKRKFMGPPYRVIGGAIRYSAIELQEWIEQQPARGART